MSHHLLIERSSLIAHCPSEDNWDNGWLDGFFRKKHRTIRNTSIISASSTHFKRDDYPDARRCCCKEARITDEEPALRSRGNILLLDPFSWYRVAREARIRIGCCTGLCFFTAQLSNAAISRLRDELFVLITRWNSVNWDSLLRIETRSLKSSG